MTKGRRSAYIRNAILAYIAETPIPRVLPLEEPANEPIRPHAVQVVGNEVIEAWFLHVPPLMRSYLIRFILNWYRRRETEQVGPQQVFKLDSLPLEPTGSDT